VFNVQGEPLDAVHNIYAFADPLRHLQAITAVRDKGAAGPLTVLAWAGTAEATLRRFRRRPCQRVAGLSALRWPASAGGPSLPET
jgi:hypothetical protein